MNLMMVAGADLRLAGLTHDPQQVPQRLRVLASFKRLTPCVSAYAFTIIKSTVAYRVAVYFRAAPLAAPTSCGVRSGPKAKTPSKMLCGLGSWQSSSVAVETEANASPATLQDHTATCGGLSSVSAPGYHSRRFALYTKKDLSTLEPLWPDGHELVKTPHW